MICGAGLGTLRVVAVFGADLKLLEVVHIVEPGLLECNGGERW